MATEISNGRQTVKLYHSVNRGKAMYQLAYYAGGRRVQKNFADKGEAKRVAKQITGNLSNDAEAVETMATPELESLVAARRVLAPGYALHVAVEEHAQAIGKLGKATLREAVEFFLRHNRADVPRLTLAEVAEQFAASRRQAGCSDHYITQCRKTISDSAKAFPGQTLPDLKTAELDAWLGDLPLAAKTKNGMRIILVACGNWAEGRGYAYDNLGRNTSFADQAGRTSTYTYDLAGNRTTSSYPSGITVRSVYDASDRLATLQDTGSATLATYSYNTFSQLMGATLANGTSVSYTYDMADRLTAVSNSLGGTVARNYSYVYDNANRVVSETEPRGTVTSGYTKRNEVNSLSEPTGSPFADQGFAYDAAFNRSSWTQGSGTTTYSVNNLNQYTTVSGSPVPTWNTDGGLGTFAGYTYTYDSLQRLTEVDCSSGKTLFSYDPLGRRVQKVDENSSGAVLATYQYHYDGSNVAVEYQPSTTWTYYLYGGNVVLRDSGTIKQWYYREGHGSVSAVADSSGNVLEAYEYNMQGQVQITNGSSTVLSSSGIGNDLLYCEYRYDSETQNYFCEARYYSTTLGRFISRDPLSGAEFSQGTNLYAYCKNNYLNATDATGMCQNESSWGAFWEGVSDGHAWEQSSAATADGLLTFGGLMGKGPFAIDAGNQYNQNISQDLGGVASAAFTAAGGVGMLGRGATQLTAAQRVQQLAQGGLTQIQRDRFVTLGVTETQEGVRIITSSSSTLEAGVRSMLTENEIGIVTDLCITD